MIDHTDSSGTARVRLKPADRDSIAEAASILSAGGLVAFPTETVYGLGADARNDHAIARVYAIKNRPRFNPLIVHFADAEAAAREALFDQAAEEAATAFWPGPLTLVLARRPNSMLSRLVSAGLETIALRVPDHQIAQALMRAANLPIAAPSANRAGMISPTLARHVAEGLGGAVDLILDGGQCPIGLESTVIDLTGSRPVLLRPGGLDAEKISSVLGPFDQGDPAAPIRSPGQLSRHYAPRHPLRLNAQSPSPTEAFLTFGPNPPAGGALRLDLSPSGDTVEAAANLFALLHEADRANISGIAVMPVPDEGLGPAINDRLRRAAAPADTAIPAT